MDERKQIVSLSGGRDSTTMLLMMLEKGERIDDIVFFDWGMEFPQMYDHLERLQAYIGRSITRLYPDKPWDYWMFDHVIVSGKAKGQLGCGWPSIHYRWCTREKIRKIRRHIDGAVDCIGYSFDERKRRPGWHDNQRYPLLEYGVNSYEALNYCKANGFYFGGLYGIFNRASCWCCPLQPVSSLCKLRDNFPDLWEKMLDMDRRSPYPFPRGVRLEEL